MLFTGKADDTLEIELILEKTLEGGKSEKLILANVILDMADISYFCD